MQDDPDAHFGLFWMNGQLKVTFESQKKMLLTDTKA